MPDSGSPSERFSALLRLCRSVPTSPNLREGLSDAVNK